jgi:arylsulfatase
MHVLGRWAAVAGVLLATLACSADLVPDDRQNILLIVADDLGYADLGAYGSEIHTPNIDALASEGVILSQFHTAPLCAPTRAMLLSGNNNHVAGMGRQGGLGDLAVSIPGYEAHLADRVAPMPRLLREAGYHTYTAGKWHLGTAPEHGPTAAGFERSFNLLHGAGSHYGSTGFFEGGSVYSEDGSEVDYPEGQYSTELFTDRLIEFIDGGRDDGRPFFAFAAYTTPHWPLQVPDDYLDRYAGVFDQGYDRLREQRMESLKAAGIIPPTSSLPPRNEAITPWEDLTSEAQRREARKMELYAAMVENLDYHVGRLVEFLRTAGLYENTVIVFMSDNGAAAEDFYYVGGNVEYLQEHYDNSYENMGKPGSWVSYGPQWAEAGSAPFSRYKGYTREGGLVAPMIVAGPVVASRGRIDSAYLTVMDLAPTFLELAGAEYPADGSVEPMLGESIVGFLAGGATYVHDDDYVTALSHGGRAYIRTGRWKLVNLEPPFAESELELFDIIADPGETTNLADVHPDVLAEMLALWREARLKLGIVLPRDL